MASARQPEIAAIERTLGIKGADDHQKPRELNVNETIAGEIVGEYCDQAGHEKYLVETEQGQTVSIPKEAGSDLSKGDEVEASRTSQGYEITCENGFER